MVQVLHLLLIFVDLLFEFFLCIVICLNLGLPFLHIFLLLLDFFSLNSYSTLNFINFWNSLLKSNHFLRILFVFLLKLINFDL